MNGLFLKPLRRKNLVLGSFLLIATFALVIAGCGKPKPAEGKGKSGPRLATAEEEAITGTCTWSETWPEGSPGDTTVSIGNSCTAGYLPQKGPIIIVNPDAISESNTNYFECTCVVGGFVCPDGTTVVSPDLCPVPPIDQDSDGVPDSSDNCPTTANPFQEDSDGNGIGSACDDEDLDTHVGSADNCPDIHNPDQDDFDADGIGDACDSEPEVPYVPPSPAPAPTPEPSPEPSPSPTPEP